MKKIGTTETGAWLVEMTETEFNANGMLSEIVGMLGGGKLPDTVVRNEVGEPVATITYAKQVPPPIRITDQRTDRVSFTDAATPEPKMEPKKRGPYKKRKASPAVQRAIKTLAHPVANKPPVHNEAETKNCARCKKLFLRAELKNGFAYCAKCSSEQAKAYRAKRLVAAIQTAKADGPPRRVTPNPSSRLEMIRQADQRVREREDSDRPVQDGRVLPVGMQE